MKNKIIDVKGLTKKYGNKGSLALDNIDLKIERGKIFGLLGPNGAGKSSFINILSGLSNKTSGKVLVCGIDLGAIRTGGNCFCLVELNQPAMVQRS